MAAQPEASGRVGHRLADIPMFAKLPPAALDELAREGRVRRYPAGQVLWNEGDPGDALLVLEEGQLKVSRVTGGGVEVVLAVMEAPAALGELALLDGEPRSAAATAQRPVTVRLIPRSAFLNLLRREPAAVDGVLRSLAAMIRSANARHALTVGLDVPGRLAAWLLARSALGSGRATGASDNVVLDRSQGELAAELGTTRSTLNRALKAFEGLGFVRLDGERVIIRDRESLAAYAEEPLDDR